MLELIIDKNNDLKTIALVENGKLVEVYEDKEKTNRNEGNIFIGKIVDIVPGMQSAFADIGTGKNSFIHLKDLLPQEDEKQVNKFENNKHTDIRKVIKKDDKILVQVKKDCNDKKGARISTHISLPSKYIVYMPNTEIVTISQKMEDEKEKERLIKLVKENLPKGNGAVIRTAAEGKKDEEIIKDINFVVSKWHKILDSYKNSKGNNAKMIYKSMSLPQKIIIDTIDKDLQKIIVNDKKEYQEIKKFLEENEEFKNIKLEIDEEKDVLDIYDIKKEMQKVKNRKIWLKSGGFITIDSTEALVAIDVNTGKYTGKSNLEDTVYKVNYEATIEIAKQLRLRDIGGIIIIDYIDMHVKENKEKIEKLLKEVLKEDRAKTQVEGFTNLELMELTRKHICSHIEKDNHENINK
jgi:ribonuclease G